MAVVGRFVPSPSGRIHLGNILCCLLAWLSARSKGGQVILRIEDLDTARCPRRYAEQMCRDILWLGLPWDEGPGVGGPDEPYEQSRRTALYQAALERLEEMGLVYPCFCTRAELHAASAPHREDGQVIYPGTCRRLTPEEAAQRAAKSGRPPALRLRVPDVTAAFTDGHMGPYREDLERDCGDFLLRRSDGLFAYQLAVEAEAAARADAVEDLGRRAGARLLKTVTSSASGEESEFSLDGIDWSAWKEVHLVADPYTDSGAVVTVYACGSNAVMCVLSGNTLSDREQHTSIGHMVLYPLFDARKRVSVVDLYEGEIRNVGYQFSQLTHVRMEVNNGHALYAGSTLEVWGAK